MFLCETLMEPQDVPVQTQVANSPSQLGTQLPSEDGLDSEDVEFSDELPPEEVPESSPFQEILPLKRYYLIRRLEELKSKLEKSNIENQELNLIIKFLNNLSYDSIVSLSLGIIPVIEDQLARTYNAEQNV